jgi:hypothetical protein
MADQAQNQMPPPPPPAQNNQPPPPPLAPAQNNQQQQQMLVNPVNQPANNVPIVQAQVVQGADGGNAVKVQQTKLPEFWGQKDKDSISANEFVKPVDKMMSANNWSDKVAFDNFGLALKGSANTWLDSQVLLKKIPGDRECWSIIRPFFKEEFATESDDKLILDGLTHMAMRPTKHDRDFFGRLARVNTVILDAYQGYTLAPQDPVPDANGNIVMTQADHQNYRKALMENVVEFYILNQFRGALLPDLRRVINLQPMHTLDLDTAVRLATIELRSKEEARGTSKIQAVQQEEEGDNVEAVTQNRQKKFTPSKQQN